MSMTNEEIIKELREKNRLLEIELSKVEIHRDLLRAIGETLINEHWYNRGTTSEFVQCNSSRTAPPTWRKLAYALKLTSEV